MGKYTIVPWMVWGWMVELERLFWSCELKLWFFWFQGGLDLDQNWWNIWPVKDRNDISSVVVSKLQKKVLFWEMIQFDQYFSDGLKPPSSKPPARSSLTNIRSLSNEGPRRQVQFGKLEKRAVQGRTIYFFLLRGMLLGCFGSFLFQSFFPKDVGHCQHFSLGLVFRFFDNF